MACHLRARGRGEQRCRQEGHGWSFTAQLQSIRGSRALCGGSLNQDPLSQAQR